LKKKDKKKYKSFFIKNEDISDSQDLSSISENLDKDENNNFLSIKKTKQNSK